MTQNKAIKRAKKSFIAQILTVVFSALFATSVFALGLGKLEIDSSLEQPLSGQIELRVNSNDDVSSVVAGIANRADFDSVGIDYPKYLDDIGVNIERGTAGNYVLKLTSNGVVINEPFIHFLIRVNWSGGSFLREYTALIDPPTYGTNTIKNTAEPRVVGVDEYFGNEDSYVESFDQSATRRNVPSSSGNSTLEVAGQDAQYGPVASGESLSMIAQELQLQFPDLSIYQIMRILFDENREAFIDDNINGLKKGSVLQISGIEKIRNVDLSDARRFFSEQLLVWDPSSLVDESSSSVANGSSTASGAAVRVAQDEYALNEFDSSSQNTLQSDSGSTASFQVGSSLESDAQVSSGDDATSSAEVLSLRNEITELQASLASSTLENTELLERISSLEGQLADMNRLMNLYVEDIDMAAVESQLADQNNVDSLLTNNLDDSASVLAQDNGFIDPLVGNSAQEPPVEESSDIAPLESQLVPVADDGKASGANSAITSDAIKNTSSSMSEGTPRGFFAGFMSSLTDGGLWKILVAIGALILGAFALLLIRRRRADEEYEISMMSVQSFSQLDDQSAAAETKIDVPTKKTEKQSSFLSVYSETDGLVQADEVDPVAEADVYIAYGRDEQAEEVLVEGIAVQPERIDIRHKLLTLYHKNNNVAGFERVAEELYSQSKDVTDDVWQEVSLMGKDLAPENPLFEVSMSDLSVRDEPNTNMSTNSLGLTEADEAKNGAMESSLNDDSHVEVVSNSVSMSNDNESNVIGMEADDLTAQVRDSDAENKELIPDEVEKSNSAEIDLELKSVEPNSIEFSIEDTILDESGDDFDNNDLNMDALDIEGLSGVELDIDQFSFSESINEDLTAPTGLIESNLDTNEDAADYDLDFDDGASEITLRDFPEPSAQVPEGLTIETGQRAADKVQIEDDYNEARTQYELAKVFVDLGDEDGAKRILDEIVVSDNADIKIVNDARALLSSLKA